MADTVSSTGAGEAPAVLLLDDEEDVILLLTIVLERAGYLVRGTTDGREGLRLLGEGRFDVALADLLMPGMGGREFLAEVARLDPGRRPNVLIVSALRPEAVERELAGLACFAVVSKPFELAEIQERVAEAVAARRADRA